jgi:hypothetical protein
VHNNFRSILRSPSGSESFTMIEEEDRAAILRQAAKISFLPI